MDRFTTKIFIDGGEPEETRQANELMFKHFGKPLDGQTTNPTLIARNLLTRAKGNLTEEKAVAEYKRIVQEISKIIPYGSVSIQVFSDRLTKSEEMIIQARERNSWIINASIKFPCTVEGLKAASVICREMPVNITLVFSQSQAAAVHQATLDGKHPIYISPFVGRLDDMGENGMETVKNIKNMYKNGDGHVEVLTASIRNIEHILYALFLKSDIITVPFKVFKLWADQNFPLPDETYRYNQGKLKPIPYNGSISLGKNWEEYDLKHILTDRGIEAFYSDWTGLFQ